MQKIGLEAILDMGNFKKGLKDFSTGIGEMNTQTEKAGGMLGKLGSVAGGLVKVGVGAAIVGVGALTGVLVGSIKAAAEAQQVEAQLDQVLKSTGGAAGMTKDEILGLANALSEVTPFEDELIISTETMLLQFKNIGEEVFPQATEMALDLAQRLGIDAPSAARLLGKALEEPGEGLLRLKQAGIAFTDEQEAMIAKMVAAGDAAGAQKYIMDQLATSVGGSARAAGETFSGQMEIVKNKIGNVTEGIGAAFLPMVTQMVGKFSEFVTNNAPAIIAAFEDLAAWLGTNIPVAIAAVSGFWTTTLLPAIQTVWAFISENVVPILQTLALWLGENLPKAIKFLGDYYTWLWTSILKPVFSWILGTLIPILGDIFEWLGENIPTAIDALSKAFVWLKDNILEPVAEAFGAIADAVQWVIDKIVSVIEWINKMIAAMPDWLIPGSATPFEMGLRGINDAMRSIAAQGLPEMTFGIRGMAPAGAGAGGNTYGGDTIVLNINNRDAWAGAQSWIESRRRERINMGM